MKSNCLGSPKLMPVRTPCLQKEALRRAASHGPGDRGILSGSRGTAPRPLRPMSCGQHYPFLGGGRGLTWMFCCIFFFSACRCWQRSSSSSTLASRS